MSAEEKKLEEIEKTELNWISLEQDEQELPEPFEDVLVMLEGGEVIDAFLQRPRNDVPAEWHDYEGRIARKVIKWAPQPHTDS